MPEQGGSFVDLLFVKSPTEASLEISVCTAAICLLFTSKTLTLTISLKPWSMSRNRYSSDDHACFFNLARKEEGRQKYIISSKEKRDYRKRMFIYSGILYLKGIKLSRSHESNQRKQKDWPVTKHDLFT